MSEESSPNDPQPSGKIALAAVIWTFVAIFWFAIQFVLSEGLFRASEFAYSSTSFEELGDQLSSLSDTIAWPAGVLYDRKLSDQVETGYYRALQDPNLDPAVKEKLETASGKFDADFSDYDLHYEVADILEDYPDHEGIDFISPVAEYAIYLGTCLAWGFAVGILGFLISLGKILHSSRETTA